jgi:simple sugar transport system ATP-binding protein
VSNEHTLDPSGPARPQEVVPALAGRGLWKQFGPVTALEDVSFEARYGHVLALLGDNGAGKTTLIKLLGGVMQPDAGEILMDGAVTRFRSAADARNNGIATVFQDLAVCELLSITRNIVLGNEPTFGLGPIRLYDAAAADRIAVQALDKLGARMDRELSSYARTLSGGQRQALAIARAMFYGSKCLILDEPTAALAARQAQGALDHMRAAADAGQAVILITHNYAQALSVADDVLILAHGKVAGSVRARDVRVEDVMALVSR